MMLQITVNNEIGRTGLQSSDNKCCSANISGNDPEKLVRKFHEVYGLPIVDCPDVNRERVHMRMALIAEEFGELVRAIYGLEAEKIIKTAVEKAVACDDSSRDTVEAADALADIIYVIYGMALEMGIPIAKILEQVQASNLSKLGIDGKPIYREDGKVIKGPSFFPPNVRGVIKEYGWTEKK